MKGYTIRQIAEILGISYRAAQKRIERAGIKPLTRSAIYSAEAYDCIKETRRRGRPSKNNKDYSAFQSYSGEGVYFIQDLSGYTKIGITNDLGRRIVKLQSDNSSDLVLISFFQSTDSKKLEDLFHHVFDNYKVRGEWFNLTNEQIQQIKAIETKVKTSGVNDLDEIKDLLLESA